MAWTVNGKRGFHFRGLLTFWRILNATKHTRSDTDGHKFRKHVQPMAQNLSMYVVDQYDNALVGTACVWMSYGGDSVGASNVIYQKSLPFFTSKEHRMLLLTQKTGSKARLSSLRALVRGLKSQNLLGTSPRTSRWPISHGGRM